ncbi:MAG: 5'/3'-nucleotidase SurE [Myxococcales bacterium]|jgi:5'-nucleotidase|nr:5'/3'-nucleotidase SurE [Myxococcales bacterium]
MNRPLVLLSNDDGYDAPGIVALREALATWAEVVTVAPETEQSATSHALSLARPLRPRRLEPGLFAVDGTPADCVYVALHAGTRFLPRRPDMVVSGINRGLNLGQDVFYSGTVAAAREGALRGIPAIAASAHGRADLVRVAALVVRLARSLHAAPRAGRAPLLNLNVPEKWSGEVRAARTGSRLYEELVEFRDDPRGREYLWLGGPGVKHEPDPGSDTDAYDAGAASLTPLSLDLTNDAARPLCEALVSSLHPDNT